MTYKVVLSIFLFVVIAFSIFTVFQFTFSDSLTTRQRIFYEQDFDPTINKILLLGSSHVGQINATHVDALISKKISPFIVYNLADTANNPSKRFSTIDEILKLKPSIVVYGVGYRDFSDKSEINKDIIFPDPQKIILDSLLLTSFNNYVDFLENPKLVTLNTIRSFLKTQILDNSSELVKKNTPFYPYGEKLNNIIRDNSEIEKNHDKNSIQIKINLKNNPEINSLEKIIETLQQNNVIVILFSTPHHTFYTDLISDSDKNSFDLILKELSQKYDLEVYYLENKYSTLNIWVGTNHIAHNPNSMIYSEDISKMILKEFD